VNKEVGKCHQAKFLTLPVIIGLIMATHANQIRKRIKIKEMIVDQ
jgi:hypothetical protein